MLVLSRKIGQQIRIGDQITLTIVKTQGQTVRVGIEAPRDVRVVRAELPPRTQDMDSNRTAPKRPTDSTPNLNLLSANSASTERLPGKDATNRQIRTQPSHPLRWTVANMRERVQSQMSPRPAATSSAGHPV